MSFENTPTNGNGRGAWTKHVPLGLALGGLASVAALAGGLRADVGTLREDVTTLKAAARDASLDTRVRTNTENIRGLQAALDGHLDKSAMQWGIIQADIAAIKSAINDLRRSNK